MFKVKIDTNAVVKLELETTRAVQQILKGEALQKEVGTYMVTAIQYQARVGKPLTQERSLPALKESSIRTRRYLAKHNTTHKAYNEKRSNVTITGALLDSIVYTAEGGDDLNLKITFEGKHPGYKSANGPMGEGPDNLTLAGYLKDKGFKIFDNTIQANQQFTSRIKTICLRYIRRGLRIRNRLAE